MLTTIKELARSELPSVNENGQLNEPAVLSLIRSYVGEASAFPAADAEIAARHADADGITGHHIDKGRGKD